MREGTSSGAGPKDTMPRARQARPASSTMARSSSGSSENALSTAPSARRSVTCFSMTVAPSATLATGTPMPRV